MTRSAAHRLVDQIFRLEAIETLAVVRPARPRFGIDLPCARQAGPTSRPLPHTA